MNTTPQIQPLPPLHPWICLDPLSVVKELEAQEFHAKLLTKGTTVLITALALTTLAIQAGLLPTGTSFSFAVRFFLFPIGVSALTYTATQSQKESKRMEEILTTERAVKTHLCAISHWKEPEVTRFLHCHNIKKKQLPASVSLLPLIARFKAKAETASNAQKSSEKLFESAKRAENRDIRLLFRNAAWFQIESVMLPAAIEAAYLLQILKEPTQQLFPDEWFQLTKKSFAERQFDRLYDHTDEYLRFVDGSRAPLTLEEVMKHPSPDALCKKLFP